MTELLVAPKHISSFTPEEYRDYVKGQRTLYLAEQEAKKERRRLATVKKPTALIEGINFRVNAKGTPILTVRRKPKWISPGEIELLAQANGTKLNWMWLFCRAKGLHIGKGPSPENELPW